MRGFKIYYHAFLGIIIAFCSSLAMGAPIIKSADLGTSGDGCIFDLVSTGDGTLLVSTKANTNGDFWRTVIIEVGTPGARGNVGNGSTTQYSGWVSRNVVSGKKYEVLIVYEAPISTGNFPAGVSVRFNGPVTISGPRPTSGSPEGQTCMQSNEIETSPLAVDVEGISCGTLITCKLDTPADTDSFTFTASQGDRVDIKVAGPGGTYGELFDPSGNHMSRSDPLPANGQYTILVHNVFGDTGDYTISLQKVGGQ